MKAGRVHAAEWLTGLLGVVLLVGLLLPWSSGESALASISLLDLLLLAAAAAAILLPLVVASSRRTDVPIVYETTLWSASLLLGLILVIRAAFPPDAGFESGFWLIFISVLLLGLTLWRSVRRER